MHLPSTRAEIPEYAMLDTVCFKSNFTEASTFPAKLAELRALPFILASLLKKMQRGIKFCLRLWRLVVIPLPDYIHRRAVAPEGPIHQIISLFCDMSRRASPLDISQFCDIILAQSREKAGVAKLVNAAALEAVG